MKTALNQPHFGMGDFTGEVPQFTAKTASPPATGTGIMDSIVGGIRGLFGAVTAEVPSLTQRLLYGQYPVYSTFPGQQQQRQAVLAPKAGIPTEYLLLGGGVLVLLLSSSQRGRK